MVKKRRRSLRHQLRNPVAKDLRSPKYKIRVIKDKRRKQALQLDLDKDYELD